MDRRFWDTLAFPIMPFGFEGLGGLFMAHSFISRLGLAAGSALLGAVAWKGPTDFEEVLGALGGTAL